MSKILTIIVPSYNMEKHLDRCLSSLLVDNDNMSLLDVLVVNDGSKDNTSAIAHRYERQYPDTFRVLDKDNGHYGSCVNVGVDRAVGTFVKVLDADDALDTSALNRFLLFLCEQETKVQADLVISGFSFVGPDDTRLKDVVFSKKEGAYSVNQLSSADKLEWFIHGLTYRTALLKQIGYKQTEGIAYTDHEWAFIPMTYVKTIYCFPGILYLYSIGLSGQSVEDSVHAKNLWMEAKVAASLVDFYALVKNEIVPDNERFLRERLELVLTHLYQLYLLSYNRYRLPKTPLNELDSDIKNTCPDLYNTIRNYSTRIAGIKFYPIQNWQDRKQPHLFIQTHLYRMTDALNKFLGR